MKNLAKKIKNITEPTLLCTSLVSMAIGAGMLLDAEYYYQRGECATKEKNKQVEVGAALAVGGYFGTLFTLVFGYSAQKKILEDKDKMEEQ